MWPESTSEILIVVYTEFMWVKSVEWLWHVHELIIIEHWCELKWTEVLIKYLLALPSLVASPWLLASWLLLLMMIHVGGCCAAYGLAIKWCCVCDCYIWLMATHATDRDALWTDWDLVLRGLAAAERLVSKVEVLLHLRICERRLLTKEALHKVACSWKWISPPIWLCNYNSWSTLRRITMLLWWSCLLHFFSRTPLLSWRLSYGSSGCICQSGSISHILSSVYSHLGRPMSIRVFSTQGTRLCLWGDGPSILVAL